VPDLTRRQVLLAGATLAGALSFPALRLGRAAETPIRRVVILMQENRSFDHYFGLFPNVDGLPHCAPLQHASSQCLPDVPHGSVATSAEAARGFLEVAGPRALTYYTGEDLPYYWALARRFTICDRYFSSAPGATFPNRLFSIAGSAGDYHDNPSRIDPARLPRPTLVDRLDEARIAWSCYVVHQPDAMYNPVAFYPERRGDPRANRTYEEFLADAARGRLPPVSWVVAQDPITEHPPSPPGWGERFAALTINSIAAGPGWHDTVLLLVYDEHGGFFDHVLPMGGSHAAGFRVPAIVVSPYARPGHVSHAPKDHSSLIAFISTLFGLPSLGHPTAKGFEDCLDLDHAETDFVAFPTGQPLPDCHSLPAWAASLLSRPVPGGEAIPAPAPRGICPEPAITTRRLEVGAAALLAAGGAAGAGAALARRRAGRSPAGRPPGPRP
jgi:phospholipase C